MVLATIRANAAVTSKMDYFCSSTMFAPVGEEAATLILAGEHFVDLFDFDISEVVFLCKAECTPVMIILKNVPDSERGVGKDAEQKCEEVYFRRRAVKVHQICVWLILAISGA